MFKGKATNVQQSSQLPPNVNEINPLQARLLSSAKKSEQVKSDMITLSAMKNELHRIANPRQSQQAGNSRKGDIM